MTYLITLNYNSSQYTIDFLESLENVKTDYRLIVVDNCSNSEDFKRLKKNIDTKAQAKYIDQDASNFIFEAQTKIILIREEVNRGFSAGNNQGIRIACKQADFDGIVLINNDTFVEPGFLNEILKFRKLKASADLIGCRILFDEPNDLIWYDGGKYYKHTARAIHINENKYISEIDSSTEPRQTGFITGCFMYISKHCIERIGLLDESLFMYNEDMEYCVRASKNGLHLYQVPTAVIWHRISTRSGMKTSCFAAYWGARNKFKVSRMHLNFVDQAYTLILYVLTRIPRFLSWLVHGRTDLIKAQTKGLIDGLKNDKK